MSSMTATTKSTMGAEKIMPPVKTKTGIKDKSHSLLLEFSYDCVYSTFSPNRPAFPRSKNTSTSFAKLSSIALR